MGYNNIAKTHMYLSLTNKYFAMTKITDFPLPYAPFNCSLGNTEHSESVKIGALGVAYEKYDYLINDGNLYRYMGLNEKGNRFRYVRLMGNHVYDTVEIPYQLINYAKQIVCGK